MKSTISKLVNIISIILIVIGFSFCLGSIVAFISMNIIETPNEINLEFIHWQRIFIKAIMDYVTIPGIWLFFIGNCVWFISKIKIKGMYRFVFLISLLIFCNVLFAIVPTAKIVNDLATDMYVLSNSNILYNDKKMMEDLCGGINLLLLLVYFILTLILVLRNQKESVNS